MTTAEARARLDASPFKDGTKPSKINKGLTQAQSWKIVSDAIAGYRDDETLPEIFAKRVIQVSENRCRCEVP